MKPGARLIVCAVLLALLVVTLFVPSWVLRVTVSWFLAAGVVSLIIGWRPASWKRE